MVGAFFLFVLLFLRPAVAFPKDAVFVSLNSRVRFCHGKALLRPDTILFVHFYIDKMTSQLLCRYSRSPGTCKRVQNNILGVGACQDNFCIQFFRLLGGVICIFRHGPERNGYVIPEIRRAGIAIFPFFRLHPVLGGAVHTITCQHLLRCFTASTWKV